MDQTKAFLIFCVTKMRTQQEVTSKEYTHWYVHFADPRKWKTYDKQVKAYIQTTNKWISSKMHNIKMIEEKLRNQQPVTDEELTQMYQDFIYSEVEYNPIACYDERLLQLMLTDPRSTPTGKVLSSSVSRCIENDYPSTLTTLLTLPNPDKQMFLRRIRNVHLYTQARHCGYIDTEFEKRVVLIQRLFRGRSVPTDRSAPETKITYDGPELEDYQARGEYFGYRHSVYAIRWDRTHRHRLYAGLLKHDRYLDCAWQAYVDFLGETDL